MNAFLKACLDEAFDLVNVAQELIEKQWSTAISNVIKGVSDAGPIAANVGDAKPELQALLTDPAADADVLAYVATKAAASVESPQVAAIVKTAADLALNGVIPCIEKGVALADAIKAAKNPTTAPAA